MNLFHKEFNSPSKFCTRFEILSRHAMLMWHWLMAMPAFQVLHRRPQNDFLSFGKKGKSRTGQDLENLSMVGKYAWILKQASSLMIFRELILVFGIFWYNRRERVRLDHHSRRIHAINLWFFCRLQVIFLFILSYLVSIFLMVWNSETVNFALVRMFANHLCLKLGNILGNCLVSFFSYPILVILVYTVSIWQKYFVLTPEMHLWYWCAKSFASKANRVTSFCGHLPCLLHPLQFAIGQN